MGSDSRFTELSGSVKAFNLEDHTIFPKSDQYVKGGGQFYYKDPSLDFNFVDNHHVSPTSDLGYSALSSNLVTAVDLDSPSDDNEFSETVINYISQVLMEEDMETKPCMFHDPLALQAAEKSLYDVLGEKSPPSPGQSSSYGDQFLVDSPDDGFSSNFSDYSGNGSFSSYPGLVDPQWSVERGELKPSFMETPLPTKIVFQSPAKSTPDLSFKSYDGVPCAGNSEAVFSVDNIVVPDFFSEADLALQFKRGVEEANKFLPKVKPLVIDLESYQLTSDVKEKVAPKVDVKAEKEEKESLSNWLNGKKNHGREDEGMEEERSNKQSAVSVDEGELSEMFDKALVFHGHGDGCQSPHDPALKNERSKTLEQNAQSNANGSNGGKIRSGRQGNKKEVVDLRTLLILCAQAVSSGDRRTSNELLKQIRQHSSPSGDGSQRSAHCFANALEARLAGTGTQIYTELSSTKTSAADMLKAFLAYIAACPFKKMAIIFANHNILKVAENATTLHVIDFGILYGFQWPPLIYRLAHRPGGPPKLRITGIELPQSGFRPGERVQETGRRLAKYCERHNVPFEYNAIAQKWETIQIEDLNLRQGEVLAVNCLCRFRNLLDETVVINSPRNTVLNLIRKTNPNIFVHSVVNGSYNAPFFVGRFREALFHFSALFDMCDTNMPREDPMRLKYEEEFVGREVMNAIACEGSDRVERPETYKQWEVRNKRAGLKQLPLDPMCIKKLKCKVKGGYREDFMVDEDGAWVLQGWKGRILYASSAWIPA